jgi:haloalkane dehalogenase
MSFRVRFHEPSARLDWENIVKCLRTPDERFADLPDFDFNPNYVEFDDTEGGRLRMHYLDEGPSDAAPVLLMHGEPAWCYLYRHMIPIFAAAGQRVVAPDLVGFGRSDKPTERADYTYQRHVDWMTEWLQQVDLKGITLVCQDWGGLIGLRLVASMPERFSRVVVANTALPTGDKPMGAAFQSWRDFSQSVPDFNAGRIVYGGTTSKITVAEAAAYNAPFPDARFQAGARQFPMLVPDTPDNPASAPNRAAWEILRSLDIPFLTVFGADDKIMAGVDRVFQKSIPGAAGQNHAVLPDAGHFLQEDAAPELAQATLEFIA